MIQICHLVPISPKFCCDIAPLTPQVWGKRGKLSLKIPQDWGI
jgi:hypothetical protein